MLLSFSTIQHRQLWALALPMILSNITVPLLGLVDTAVIGHLDKAYFLGGVALGSTIITLMVWLLGFLRMSTTGLVAQAFGSQDTHKQQQLLMQGIMLASLLGIIALIVKQPLLSFAFNLTSASEDVIFYAKQYVDIRIWSLPFALINLVLLGWLLGRQAPKAAMWQLIIANLVNIILDIVFVIGFNWQVQGAALASVIADICAFMIAATVVAKQLKLFPNFSLKGLIAQANIKNAGELLRLNRDIFIRSLCLQAAFSFMTFYGAGLGDNVIAANAVLLNLVLLISYALDGIAYYAEAEVGRAIGQKDKSLLTSSVALAFIWSGLIALLFSFVFAMLGAYIVNLLTSITAVQHTAEQFLIWVALMPILAFGCYLFDGVYIGAAQGRVMRNSMLLATFGVYFPLWWLLQPYGNHALWAALSAFMLFRSVSLGWHYHFKLSKRIS